MSHSELLASGARPFAHCTHDRPVALAQPWFTWSNSFGSLHIKHSTELSDGCCPLVQRSHTPSRPAWPSVQAVQPVCS